MMNFRVGQKVECIAAGKLHGVFGRRWDKGEALELGKIYTVRSVHIDHDGDLVLWLDEVRRSDYSIRRFGPLCGYLSSRFRPLVEKKTDAGMAILQQIRRDVENNAPVKITERA